MLVLISSMASSWLLASRCSTTRADPALLVADDAAVAGGVVDAGGEQRAGRPGEAVLHDEGGEGVGPHERGVAGQDHDVAVVGVGVAEVLGEAGQAHGDGVAGAPLDPLLDELEGDRARLLLERLDDPVGPVADHDDGPVGPGSRRRRRGRTGRAAARTAGAGAWDGPSASGCPARRRGRWPTAVARSLASGAPVSESPLRGAGPTVHLDLAALGHAPRCSAAGGRIMHVAVREQRPGRRRRCPAGRSGRRSGRPPRSR